MVMTIIWAIIIGAIIGGLARLVMPGRQNISVVMTILLGALGSLIGSWLLMTLFGYTGGGGIAWWGLVAGVAVAAILIAIYLNLTGRRRQRV